VYQAAGLFDKAIAAYQKNQLLHPNTLAASKSAVPLAQAYIAKGPDYYKSAERVLLSVLEDNKLLTPDSEEFKQSLFELAQLFYRTSRYEESINRLKEFVQRYSNDERLGQLTFVMADSYRKLATQADQQLAAKLAGAKFANANPAAVPAPAGVNLADAARIKRERLTQAKELFDHAIELYGKHPPAGDVDKLYLKLSHFYRADCLYDMGQYADAITLYDSAAFKYQNDPSALAAYVQIVNAYYAMGKTQEAKTANERAKWLLKRIPEESFSNGSFAMPKEYWSQWLKWASEAGMW
jgi:tetratricopeptide (TPR) repeat protein